MTWRARYWKWLASAAGLALLAACSMSIWLAVRQDRPDADPVGMFPARWSDPSEARPQGFLAASAANSADDLEFDYVVTLERRAGKSAAFVVHCQTGRVIVRIGTGEASGPCKGGAVRGLITDLVARGEYKFTARVTRQQPMPWGVAIYLQQRNAPRGDDLRRHQP